MSGSVSQLPVFIPGATGANELQCMYMIKSIGRRYPRYRAGFVREEDMASDQGNKKLGSKVLR